MSQSPSFLDSLLCQEEQDHEYWSINNDSTLTETPSLFLEQDLFWEDDELKSMLSKEKSSLRDNSQNDSLALETRKESVHWILKVVAYYGFSNVTVVLAVNYLDRFLSESESGFETRREKPWMTQLAAVACLSLAAKVEETQVPLLLDLQVEEARYVFEAKTIQNMEILVLTTLDWKMNLVTPISFIDHFTRRFGFKDQFCCDFLSRCECLVVSLIPDSRFMRFQPSVLATATMLHVMNTIEPCSETEYRNQLLTTLEIHMDQLDDCFKLISDATTESFNKSNKRKLISVIPGSPSGVIDVCFSSDSSCDSWVSMAEVPSSTTTSVSSSPEPMLKKIRMLCPTFLL